MWGAVRGTEGRPGSGSEEGPGVPTKEGRESTGSTEWGDT